MTDYKQTLNLPKTGFPMKANLAQREPEMLKRWSKSNLHKKLREARADKEKFILHDGPPYANGNIHIGHAVNKTLKDIVVKSQTLNDKNAPYVPGWDCHGLPIEVNVEKKIGKPGVKVTPEEFRAACRKYAATQVDLQREDFKRLGLIGDWDHPYLTMDFAYEANVIRTLKDIIANGHLQQGFKPVHWCFECGSSLAEAEVEYKDKQSPSIDVKFQVKDADAFVAKFDCAKAGKGDVSLVIWTTTPWTLPANRGVAVHADLDYALVQIGEERLVFAHDMLGQVMERYGVEHYEVLGTCLGAKLDRIALQHPFYNRESLLMLGDHVTTDAGTGCVHTAPSHGADDYRIGLQYDLPIDNCVKANGVFADDVELFAGQFILKANAAVIETLKTNNKLMHEDSMQHSYPHCWRHKTPVIFRATPQWFVSMTKANLEKDALSQLDSIRWLPTWGQERMEKMLKGRPDWCISRQRTWGVPLPLLVHKDTQELHPDHLAIMDKVAEQVEAEGVDAWFKADVSEYTTDKDYVKVTDVLDVWFDSGCSHRAVLKSGEWPDLQYPADLYLEGSDQYRGWFQTSMLTGVATTGQAPYKALVTHGFTVDAQGRKMSKSVGNVVAPEKIFKTLGADILRLWIASTDFTAEMTVSDEIFKRTADTYRRIRNTARFLLSNLDGFEPAHSVANNDMIALDRWAVDLTARYQAEIIQAYNNYEFLTVTQKIHHFCSIEMGSFYLDVVKDRQYTCKADSVARRSTQTAMHHILQALVRWIAPITCFTADEMWPFIPGEQGESVHLATWYEGLSTMDEGASMNNAYWANIMLVRDVVNKAIEVERNADKLGSALEAHVTLYAKPELKAALAQLDDELRFVLITSDAQVLDESEKPNDAQATELDGLFVSVDASSHEKCERCWHRRKDVNSSVEYPGICSRCVGNIAGEGEVRQFA